MGRSTKINGEALKKRREAVCLTQAQLGEKLGGMSDENIGAIERANPPRGILSKRLPALADALRMSMDDIKRELVASSQSQDVVNLRLNGEIAREIVLRAKELEVAPAKWAAAAIEAVLKLNGWRPETSVLAVIKDTARPHIEVPGVRPLHGGGAGRKAAKK